MKKQIFAIGVLALLATTAFAQDDMYFIPKKAEKTAKAAVSREPSHKGLDVQVDEYNRMSRGSSYQIIGTDSLGNDIIEFSKVDSVDFQPDDRDFYYTSRMGMFDDYYGWYDPWFYGYRGAYWGHYYPYYYSSWYNPWGYPGWYGFYDPFYDPFYFSPYGWYGWNSWYPWNWYRPYYHYAWYGGIGHRYANSGELARHTDRPALSNYGRGYSSLPYGNVGGRTVANRTYRGGSSASNRTAYVQSSNQMGGLRRSGGGSRTSTSSYSRSSSYQPSTSSYSRSSSYQSSTPARSSSSWSSGSSSSGGSFSAGGGAARSGGGGGSFGGGGSRSGGSFGGGGRGR